MNEEGPLNPESEAARMLSITELGVTRTTKTATGCELRIIAPTVLILLSDEGILDPSGLRLTRGAVVLLPSPGVFHVNAPVSGLPIQTVAVSINFTIYNLDARISLPQRLHRFSDTESRELRKDIISFSHMTESKSDLLTAAKRLSIGYNLVHAICGALVVNDSGMMERGSDPAFQAVLDYLKTHFRQPLTIDDVARDCKMGVRALYRLVSKEAGSTPMRLLKTIRLEHSRTLLKEDLRIEDVAREVGFPEANHFSREFKKAFGITAMQCRQQDLIGVRAVELLKEADSLFQQKRYHLAAEKYERLLKSIPEWSNVDQVHYNAGLAYHRLGDHGSCARHWETITTLRYQLLAKLHLYVLQYALGRHDRVVESLHEIYRDGDASMREKVAVQAVGFLYQCAVGQNFGATRKYVPFCKERATDHPSTHHELARSLLLVGDYEDVLRLCPDEIHLCARALRSAGLYMEHLDRYPHMRSSCARIHLNMGDDDIVLSNYTDQQPVCIDALIQKGQYQLAIDTYPQHNAPALLAAGEYDRVLEQHPDNNEACMWALALSGRHQEALTRWGSNRDLLGNLLLFLESVDELVRSDLYEATYKDNGILLHGIHLLEEGKTTLALETLNALKDVNDPEYRLGDTPADLLIPLVNFLLPDESRDFANSPWTDWNAHYRSIVSNHRYLFVQELWYSVRFILDEIDEAEYHKQPLRRFSQIGIILLKGIKADYHREHSKAGNHYADYLERTTPTHSMYFYYVLSLPVTRAFARWRLSCIVG